MKSILYKKELKEVQILSNLSKSSHVNGRENLRADCENCFGLCCVALPFAASADFAFDKDGGQPCQNLQSNFRCGIHKDLRQKGLKGCAVYECFGAGQKVLQITFKGNDWRDDQETAKSMFAVFPIMQQLHEMLWYLTEARARKVTHSIHNDLRYAIEETEQLTLLSPDSLIELDVPAHRGKINVLLLRSSELVREEARVKHKISGGNKKIGGRGIDLIGANLRKADLIGANLRGAYLIAADLSKADLRGSDLIGADFRDADLSGADLTGSIFLTQDQLNAAKGDSHTKLPPLLIHPNHWVKN